MVRGTGVVVRSAVVAGLVILGSTACGSPSAPVGEPAPTVTVTVTPTAAPAEASADYGFTFFEEAQLGGTWAEISDQLNYPVAGLDDCPYYGPVWNTELGTTYAYTSAEAPDSGVTLFYTQRFLAPEGAPFPRNAEGVGIGSTQAEVLAAYPDAVVSTLRDLGAGDLTIITVEDPDSESRYAFALSAGNPTVDLLQWGIDAGGQWSHLCGGF